VSAGAGAADGDASNEGVGVGSVDDLARGVIVLLGDGVALIVLWLEYGGPGSWVIACAPTPTTAKPTPPTNTERNPTK